MSESLQNFEIFWYVNALPTYVKICIVSGRQAMLVFEIIIHNCFSIEFNAEITRTF